MYTRRMPRLRVLIALVSVCIAVLAPASRGEDFPRAADGLKISDFSVGGAAAESLLVVHYNRADGNYDQWNIWCWPEGGEGTAHPLASTDPFGRFAVIPFAKTPGRAGFIVRRGNWEEKDFDQDRFVPLTKGAVTEIWVTSGEDAYTLDPSKVDLRPRFLGAFLDAPRTITLACSRPLTAEDLRFVKVVDRTNPRRTHRLREVGLGREARLMLARELPPAEVAQLAVQFDRTVFGDIPDMPVYARGILESPVFTPLDARFGAYCTPESTQFVTWSPVADEVVLLLYDDRDATEPTRTIPLKRSDRGVWSELVKGDLHGAAYRYRFTHYGSTHEAPDMWAFAANADSSRSVVVDLARVEPEGFRTTPAPTIARATDEILYEVHVRDYTARHEPTPPELRGTYLGLARNTAHLHELGVTAVHLLPVHDFTAKVGEYNWGYWTTLFNVPESNYSTDPSDPFRAIHDLRALVVALHAADLRVILDVVYNHTSDAGPESPFGAAVPYYFFRTTPAGRFTNDSGTGNGFADERPMARKYILDSLEHWLRLYNIDGFRFDLLGTHKPETVRAICERVRSIRPDATLYGEPWTGGGPTHFGKGAQRGLPIAVFNDHLRNAIRGDLDGDTVGFATGPGGDTGAIKRGVAGSIDDFAQEPAEAVNYASAHDNLTLWDKIARTQPGATDATRRMMQKLALGIVLTSQGIPFLHGGSEFARTKQGNHNSYDAGDEINDFGWKRKDEYRDVFDFVAGLALIRRSHPAFRMADDAEVRRALRFVEGMRTVAFTIDGSVAGDSWKRIFVAYNDEPGEVTVDLPAGEWSIVVNAERAGLETLATARGKVTLPPYSMIVAHAR